MKKVLIATEKPFAPAAVSQIKHIVNEAGYALAILEKYSSTDELKESIADADALIIRSDKITEEVLAAAKNLQIVVRAGAGYDNIDLKAATTKKVVAMNTPGQNSNAVAELVIAMMIYQARNQFNGKPGTEIKDKTIGIHAYGNVGKLVGEKAKACGMTVKAFDPFLKKEDIEKDGIQAVDSAEALYSECQYISLHIPATPQTINSINYDLLNLMPHGATLINTARKEVIHEAGLMQLMETRDDFNYVSDIAPDCKDEIIEKFEGRCFFTPKKMGAQTAEANVNAGVAAAQQIVNFFEKGDTTFQVN